MELHLSYSYWYILICALLAAVGAYFLYPNKQKYGFNRTLIWSLALLRLASLFTILFLLLSPVLKWLKHKENKPIVAILVDNSSSQLEAFKKINRTQYEKDINGLVQKLEQDFVVKKYTYGNVLNDSFNLNYKDATTNISQAIEEINGAYENENLGAVVLTGDGIYNQGVNPATTTFPLRCAVYAVGVGDTTLKRDVQINRVYANKVVHLGDKFAVKMDLSAFSATGEKTNINLSHINTGKNLGSKYIAFSSNKFSGSTEFILDASIAGVQHYRISASAINGEQNITNNATDFYVEVIDNKEKVLIAYNAPHPDINALREILGGLKNNNIEVVQADKIKQSASAYNLIVLHNLPSTTNTVTSLLQQAKANNISTLFIIGNQTAIPILSNAQTALQIKAGAGGTAEATAILNKDFSLFTLPNNIASSLQSLPPLSMPFGQYKVGGNTQILLNQKVGSVSTLNPMLTLQQNGNQRVGVLLGEGLWRWRMYDYLQHKNHNLVDDLFAKAIQYLVVKQDKRKFKVQISKSVFNINESVVLDAELYNDNFELINSPEVSLSINGGGGKVYNYTFNKNDKSYTLNIGALPAGSYNYTAKTIYNGVAHSSAGSFVVVDINIENANTVADFGMLYSFAKNYNGEFVFANQLNSLYDKIKKNPNVKPVIKTEVDNQPLIDWKWLFGLLAVLLCAEWFIRKRNGTY